MIDFLKAYAHIHLFEGGYQGGSLTSRPGVEVDELLCYQSLMKDHYIEAALVVGFEGDAFCSQNNDFLAELIPYHPWMLALAYCFSPWTSWKADRNSFEGKRKISHETHFGTCRVFECTCETQWILCTVFTCP